MMLALLGFLNIRELTFGAALGPYSVLMPKVIRGNSE